MSWRFLSRCLVPTLASIYTPDSGAAEAQRWAAHITLCQMNAPHTSADAKQEEPSRDRHAIALEMFDRLTDQV